MGVAEKDFQGAFGVRCHIRNGAIIRQCVGAGLSDGQSNLPEKTLAGKIVPPAMQTCPTIRLCANIIWVFIIIHPRG